MQPRPCLAARSAGAMARRIDGCTGRAACAPGTRSDTVGGLIVTPRPSSRLAAVVPALIAALAASLLAIPQAASVRIGWRDLTPVQATLRASGLSEASFDVYVARVAAENLQRVREGDLDHLVYYLLQSTRISSAPAIEPALSARQLVEGLDADRRAAFLRGDGAAAPPVPPEVTARIAALLRAVQTRSGDARLTSFAALLDTAYPDPATRAAGVAAEYLRVMRFLYQKEFVAQRDAAPAAAVAELYRHRGLSTDTAIEAGYVVHLGLGVLKALEPARRVRRVLIVGPGLDLAPRTGLDESAAPESYQPWAVLDSLVSLGLGTAGDLDIVAADINPRVVAHLARVREHPPVLRLASSLHESPALSLSPEYRDYVDRVGSALSNIAAGARDLGNGQRGKTLSVSPLAARTVRAAALDIVTQRLDDERFDLIVATNILPYFDDPQLALAVANIAAMLAPGGAFLHNEQRPLIGDLAAAAGLPLQQSRHAVIATVTGARAPLYDSVFLHVRSAAAR